MLAAVLATSGACASGRESGAPSPGPATSATPQDPPTTAPDEVDGRVTLRVEAADPGPIVFHDRADPAPDEAAGAAVADAVKAWLDGHLTSLQEGGEGTLGEVAADGLLAGAPAGESPTAGAGGPPGPRKSLTTDLASPDEPVASAVYHVVILHTGEPDFARVTAYVRSTTGRLATAGFLFTPGPLTLVAAGPETSP